MGTTFPEPSMVPPSVNHEYSRSSCPGSVLASPVITTICPKGTFATLVPQLKATLGGGGGGGGGAKGCSGSGAAASSRLWPWNLITNPAPIMSWFCSLLTPLGKEVLRYCRSSARIEKRELRLTSSPPPVETAKLDEAGLLETLVGK